VLAPLATCPSCGGEGSLVRFGHSYGDSPSENLEPCPECHGERTIPVDDEGPLLIYLVHFTVPYKHAKHYIGSTLPDCLERRMHTHISGNGSRLMKAVVQADIGFEVVRTWRGTYSFEHWLKAKKNTPRQLCPACRGEPYLPHFTYLPTPAVVYELAADDPFPF
jgi:hypothetical protein